MKISKHPLARLRVLTRLQIITIQLLCFSPLMRTVAALLLAAVVNNRLRLALVRVEAPIEAVAERGPALADEEVVALGVGEDGRLHGEEEPRETHVAVFTG